MSDISYSVESFKDILRELLPLLVEHWKEVAIYQDKIKLTIDAEKYQKLEDAGILHIVTARKEGELIGYFVSFVSPHLHYCDNLYAMNDVLYLDPEYRKAGIAAGMFTYAEERLKELGCSVIVLHMKTQLPFHELAEGLGYEKVEWNYSKYIGE